MKPRVRYAGWGWLASTFALVVALLITAWASQRGAARASDTLVRGQTDVLLQAFREYLRVRPGLIGAAALDSFVTVRSEAGLRYVGIRLPTEDRVIESGTALGGPPSFDAGPAPGGPAALPGGAAPGGEPGAGAGAESGRPGFEGGGRRGPAEPIVVGNRIRTSMPVPICAQPPCTGRGGMTPAVATLEIQPVVAEDLLAGARRTFLAASLVAAALLTISLLFWRLSIQREREQHRFERDRRLASLGEMSAVLAHEIRNPLASLKGNAQLLAERIAADAPDHRKAERIVTEARRLESLIADLLDFARVGTIERALTDPNTLLRAAIEEVGAEAFVLRTSDAPPWPLDAHHLTRALTNLLRNARQASPPGTPAEVGLTTRNGTLVFRVRDHGPGLAAGDEARIFEPFYTTRTTGTGLGLAVARRIAELHDGTVTAANHAEGGAVFELVIPRK